MCGESCILVYFCIRNLMGYSIPIPYYIYEKIFVVIVGVLEYVVHAGGIHG